MDLQEIVTVISTLGFPIAVCLICFWYINKREQQHKEEVDSLTTAVQNNTLIMQKLVDRLGGV